MLRDLRQTNEKPIQTNTQLIPESDARVFPRIKGVHCLDPHHPTNHHPTSSADNNNNNNNQTGITIPDYWLRKNRTADPAAQCTVVGMAFRDYGYQMLDAWLTPLQQQQSQSWDRVETVKLLLNEGYVSKYLLQGIVTRSMRAHTKPDQLAHTWIYFDAGQQFNTTVRDPIRAHNFMTAYIYLLDGVGRVRFAASGPPTDETDVQVLQNLMQQILQPTLQHQQQHPKQKQQQSTSKRGSSTKPQQRK